MKFAPDDNTIVPRFLLPLLLALLPGISPGVAVETPALTEPAIEVNRQDGAVVLDIRYRVPVSSREAWAVLTDFENMPGFVPNLESSKVLRRSGSTLDVEQKGSIQVGMLPIHYESTRRIEIVPYRSIRSRTLSGDTRLESVMALRPPARTLCFPTMPPQCPTCPCPTACSSPMSAACWKASSRPWAEKCCAAHNWMAVAAVPCRPQKTATGKNRLAGKKVRRHTKKRPG